MSAYISHQIHFLFSHQLHLKISLKFAVIRSGNPWFGHAYKVNTELERARAPVKHFANADRDVRRSFGGAV